MKDLLQNLNKNIIFLKYKILNNKNDILNIVLFSIIIILLSFFTANHTTFFTDKGRELLIPQEILNGQVPYKDILLIYFPLTYYINAFFYKILGVSLNTLIITQTFFCIIFISIFYFCAKMFIDRKSSFALTLLVIVSCIFQHTNDLFNFIMPYSYSRAYGVMSFFCCMFCFIKLLKTDKLIYLYTASFIAGFCASCKLEFLSVYIFLLFGLFLYKRLKTSEYIKTICLSFTVPILVILTMLLQGIRLTDLIPIIKFCINFAQTDVMTNFLTQCGMYPLNFMLVLDFILQNSSLLVLIILFCFLALNIKTKNRIIYIILITVLIWQFYYDPIKIQQIWAFLPYLILFFTAIKFKELLKQDRPFLLLLIASLLISQREFFLLRLTSYGTYPFVILALSFSVIIFKYMLKDEYTLLIKKLFIFVSIILIGFYLFNIFEKCLITTYKIETNKGCVRVSKQYKLAIGSIAQYIKHNVSKEESLLVLPEGNMINFLFERHVNMKCFMMDRLYHDAYGETKAMEMIKNANNDYIIIVEGFDLNLFQTPFLYEKNENLVSKYIESNYHKEEEYEFEYGLITILKRQDKI